MQFARKVQEPGRSRNLSCLMLRRAKATEDRWRHCFQPLLPIRLSLSLSLAASVCVWHLWNNLPREFPITRFEHRSIKS